MSASKWRVACWNACLILAAVSPTAFGEPTGTPPATSAAPSSGLRTEVVGLMEDAETKLIRLAEAIPAQKYGWRPAKDVRSVSEVFLHVAGANFFIPSKFGTEPPANFKFDGYDKSTKEKAKVIEEMKTSFAHAKAAAMKLTDADMDKTAQWFDGSQKTYRQLLLILAAHQHEHLGQAIAYARSMGVAPPWSEEQKHHAKGKS